MKRAMQFFGLTLAALIAMAGALMLLSSESVQWRLNNLAAQLDYAIDPPQAQVFVPQQQAAMVTLTEPPRPTATATIDLSTPSATPPPPTDTPAPTLTPTPLPERAALKGVVHYYQMMNNCGPANLAMALSFWGWKGDQRDTAAVLKPNKLDKNVMPYEMEAFVDNDTDLQAVTRVNGDLATLKAFISSGFPVVIEKGFEGDGFDGWMGHYEVATGFDDAASRFTVQDSYKGPNLSVSYDDLQRDWRAFNYTYLVIYPPDQRQVVLDILDLNAYDNFMYRAAEQRAQDETTRLNGRDLTFALFNLGANRVALGDYTGAAQAYDSAFANYEQIPEAQRPWRMMWYQTGPYFAYYFTGRYSDVISLATQTLDAMKDPILEESYYWRGRAELALAAPEDAIADFQQCLVVHEDFSPCVEELNKLGAPLK